MLLPRNGPLVVTSYVQIRRIDWVVTGVEVNRRDGVPCCRQSLVEDRTVWEWAHNLRKTSMDTKIKFMNQPKCKEAERTQQPSPLQTIIFVPSHWSPSSDLG